ncbi:MAG: hypothetical protein LAP39_03460 [Acidobacteriia bacterium]|nr:hypothetical protein [Terriglobia bacterium]
MRNDWETVAVSRVACAGATTGDMCADRLAGIRQVCPHCGAAVQKDPVGVVTDLRQHEWCEPLGQQLILRGANTVAAGMA